MTWWYKKPTELEGRDATCSEPKRLKSGTSEAGVTVQSPTPAPPVIGSGLFREAEIASGAAFDEQIKAEAEKDYQVAQALAERPIFTTGEIIFVKGAWFKVHAITDKRLYLNRICEALAKKYGDT